KRRMVPGEEVRRAREEQSREERSDVRESGGWHRGARPPAPVRQCRKEGTGTGGGGRRRLSAERGRRVASSRCDTAGEGGRRAARGVTAPTHLVEPRPPVGGHASLVGPPAAHRCVCSCPPRRRSALSPPRADDCRVPPTLSP